MTDIAMTAIAVDWMDVCALDDLEPFWGEAALIAGHQIALVRLPGDLVFAVGNLDPVAGAYVMSRGIVGSRGDRPTIASPLHKEVYDLESGERLGADGPGSAVPRCGIVDGRVEVLVERELPRDGSRSRRCIARHERPRRVSRRSPRSLRPSPYEPRDLEVREAFVDVQHPDVERCSSRSHRPRSSSFPFCCRPGTTCGSTSRARPRPRRTTRSSSPGPWVRMRDS